MPGIAIGVAWATAIVILWVVVAALRPDATLHLGPILVPLIPSLVATSRRVAVAATLIAACVGAAAIVVLAASDLLQGPALPPFGTAVAESVTFLVLGTGMGLTVAWLRR